VRTRVFVHAGHSNPLHRTYLQHTWLWLDPGETRNVTVMFEYAPDNLTNKIFPTGKLQKVQTRSRCSRGSRTPTTSRATRST